MNKKLFIIKINFFNYSGKVTHNEINKILPKERALKENLPNWSQNQNLHNLSQNSTSKRQSAKEHYMNVARYLPGQITNINTR